jgi:hypothetical protein
MTDIVWEDGTKIAELPQPRRWIAKITYDDDDRVNWHDIDELSLLNHIVEAGPNFYSIAKIEIVINPAIKRREMLAE